MLARWSGWGAVSDIFDPRKPTLADERAELFELLTVEEYQSAQDNTLNAHYTDAALVKAIWHGMRELGFKGGNVLEPGAGSGNFIGFAPQDTPTPTRMVGVELDPITAGIAANLYPDAQVLHESFADTIAPEDGFDSVVGNVPFGLLQLYDARYNPGRRDSIHNHFIAKSVAMTRPGGVVAVITSRWTMDAANPTFRQELAQKADLVGALRLPTNAHQKAAGTKVITDVLFLRRREPGQSPADTSWTHVTDLSGEAGTLQVNEYFADNPDRILGETQVKIGQWGPELLITNDREQSDGERLHQAVTEIAAQARERGLTIKPPGDDWKPLTLAGAATARYEGYMRLDSKDRLTLISNGVETEIEPPIKSRKSELFSLLRMRDTYDALIEAERTQPDGAPVVEELRQELNERYDTYVAKYGPINRFKWGRTGRKDPETGEDKLKRNYPKLGGFRRDIFASKVLALEKFDAHTQTATKAEVFSRRTVGLPEVPATVSTPAEALAICLNEHGEVRLDTIQRLLDLPTTEQARTELGDLVFNEPLTSQLRTAAEYLSGDVRAKLRAAQAQVVENPDRYGPNVRALKEVIPPDLGPEDIEAKLGAAWIDASYVQQFARELLKDNAITITNPGGSMWKVKGGRTKSVLASDTWGTSEAPAQAIISALLQNKRIKVMRKEMQLDGSEKSVLNLTATQAANAKAAEIRERFNEWVWEDPKRSRELGRLYNNRFNNLALRSYTGDHLTFPGLSQHFELRPHQRAAVDRVLNEQSSLLAHGVGAGKTAEMVVSIMEMRRLGQARKPALVVPNHMLEQVQREFMQLYPQAKILVADKDRMSKTYREQFAREAANGDWDAIVFGHTQFKNLPLDNASREAYEDRQVAQYNEWIQDAQADPDVHDRTVKQLVKQRMQLKQRYRKLSKEVDSGAVTLNDIGLDAIIYDEAHEAKNALVRSNIQDAANDNPSWQAEDLMMKCDYLRRIGGKTVFATATPIANSVAEAYTFIRFLRPDLLEQAGIHDFDTWAATFGEIITETEMKPEGGFTQKDRFARFTNIPELLRMFHTFADVQLSEDLDLERPEVLYPDPDNPGQFLEGRQTVVVPPSDELLEYMQDLGSRATAARGGGKPPLKWSKAKKKWLPDNMLWISNDGRLAATDMRLVDKEAPDQTKIMAVADNVAQLWEQHKDDVYHNEDTGEPEPLTGSLQMVFCDLGTPKDNDPTSYDAYEDLRDQLVAKGVPRDTIRFIHEARNDKEKGQLFASCRDGRTQVIIGSTKKMGTGTNMQDRAVALHHVECPWRPVDIEQREGRLVRQGNTNSQVQILAYVTGKSFDAFMWQTALRKKKFIDQIMRGTLDVRSIEDISDTAMSFAQIQALAADDPLLFAKATNDAEVKKFTGLLRTHQRSQSRLHDTIRVALEEKAAAETAVASYDRALAQRVDTSGKNFSMVVGSTTYTGRKEAANALRKAIGVHLNAVNTNRALASENNRYSLGSLGGFNLSAEFVRYSQNDIRTLVYVEGLPSNNIDMGMFGISRTLGVKFANLEEFSSSTGHGLAMSLENTLRGLESSRGEAIAAIPQLQAEADTAQASIGKAFPYQGELDQALREAVRIRREMGMSDTEIAGEVEVQDGLINEAELVTSAGQVMGGATYGGDSGPALQGPRSSQMDSESEPADLSEMSEQDYLEAMAQRDAIAMFGGAGEVIELNDPSDLEEDSPLRQVLDSITSLKDQGLGDTESPATQEIPPPGPTLEESEPDQGAWRREMEEEEKTAEESSLLSTSPATEPESQRTTAQQQKKIESGQQATSPEQDSAAAAPAFEPEAPVEEISTKEPSKGENQAEEARTPTGFVDEADGESSETPEAGTATPSTETPVVDNGEPTPEPSAVELPDTPLERGRKAIRALDRTYSEVEQKRHRKTIQECVDYLVDADEHQDALTLIEEANPTDWQGAWSREHSRSHILFRDPEAEDKALSGDVLRISHDSEYTTIVRGTQKEDYQTRSVLKELKFKWDRRREYWHLRENLSWENQRKRLQTLLYRLTRNGRERIVEEHWQEINTRHRQAKEAHSEQVIEALRPEVEEIVANARASEGYRQAIEAIDQHHRDLREQGHIPDEFGLVSSSSRPFWGERRELADEGRDLYRQLLLKLGHEGSQDGDKDPDTMRQLTERITLAAPREMFSDTEIDRLKHYVARHHGVVFNDQVETTREAPETERVTNTPEQPQNGAQNTDALPPAEVQERNPAPEQVSEAELPDTSFAEAERIAADLGMASARALDSADEQGWLTRAHPASRDALARSGLVDHHPEHGTGAGAYRITDLGRRVLAIKTAQVTSQEPAAEGEAQPGADDAVAEPEQATEAPTPTPLPEEPAPSPTPEAQAPEEQESELSPQNPATAESTVTSEPQTQDQEEPDPTPEPVENVQESLDVAEPPTPQSPSADVEEEPQYEEEVTAVPAEQETNVADEWAPAVEVIVEELGGVGHYRRAVTAIDGIHQRLAHQGHLPPGSEPFAAQRDQLHEAARARADELITQLNEQFSINPADASVLHLFDDYAAAVTTDRLSDAELAHQRQVMEASITARQATNAPEPEPVTEDLPPREPVAITTSEQPLDPVAEEEAALARLHADVESGRRTYPEVYDADGEVRLNVLANALGMEVPGPPSSPDPVVEQPRPSSAPPEPQPQEQEEPQPQEETRPAPRSSINLAGMAPYPDGKRAAHASWWIEQHGFTRWRQSVTAAELAAPKEMPADDTIDFLKAVKEVKDHQVDGGPSAAAERYADLGSASRALAERIDHDRQHLVQAARLAAEHAARLDATRQLNLALRNGHDPEDVRPRLSAAPYRGADEARHFSANVHTVFQRWALTATADQMVNSLQQNGDVPRLQQMWTHAKEVDLTAGPGPARLRYDSLSRAAGELGLRLEADLAGLYQVSSVSTRHAARLAVTAQQQREPAAVQQQSYRPRREQDTSRQTESGFSR